MAYTQNQIVTSTNYEPLYDLRNLFKEFQITYPDGTVVFKRDFFGSDVIRLIKRITRYSAVKFDGNTPLTTYCFQIYGNTTVTPVVILYNGIHPLEVSPGRIIKFPDLTILYNRLVKNTLKSSNIGKPILI